MHGRQFIVVVIAGANMNAELAVLKRCASNFNRPNSHAQIVISDKYPPQDELESWLIEDVNAVILLIGDRWRSRMAEQDVSQIDPELVFDASNNILEAAAAGRITSSLSAVAVFMKKSIGATTAQEHGTHDFRSTIGANPRVFSKEFDSSGSLDDMVFAWFSEHVPRRSREDDSKSSPLHEAIDLANSGLTAHAEGAFMLAVARADDVRSFIEYGKFLRKQGRFGDACQQFERGVTRSQATNDLKHLALVLTEYALARQAMGHHDHATKLLAKALKASEDAGDSRVRSNALAGSSRMKKSIGDYTSAMKQAKESLEICVIEGNDAAIAAQYANIGLIYRRTGDLQLAEEWITKALHMNEAAKREECVARDLGNLALIYRAVGSLDRAREALARSIEINKRLGLNEGLANDYSTLAQIYCDTGNFPDARSYHEASLALEEKMGRVEGAARSYHGLGMVSYGVFDPPEAVKYLKRASQLFLQAGLQAESAKSSAMMRAIEAGQHPVKDMASFLK